MVAIGFLSISFLIETYGSRYSVALVPGLLTALGFAICLSAYSLRHLKAEYRRADLAFRDTACEFTSIFQNVLDGILIVDDQGVCLDGNPAAASILRFPRDKLIGENVGCFFTNSDAFAQKWTAFLKTKSHRGRAELVARDGTALFVDFTAATNYLPGRHVFIICDVSERTRAEMFLRKSEERFQHMANNIQEIFWMMDADSKDVIYVNQAYVTITGHGIESLYHDPSSYRELIHPEDRIRVLSKLQEVVNCGSFDEEFRFIHASGTVRWIWVKAFPVRENGLTPWLVGTAQDITSRKQAEMQISKHLDAAEAARAEAEALRKSTLALSENLAMDSVLDTLLQCISKLVPFDTATVLFAEDGSGLMVAREAPRTSTVSVGLTLDASESVFLQRILYERKALLLVDTSDNSEWNNVCPLDRARSWLGIPLIAAGRVLGILSLGANAPGVFTTEHLRLTKSLAIPAAVAIQNARVHERAAIYAAELEVRLKELHETQKALEHSESKSPRLRDL
jgi:PAS domain S-box-containing protein